jgi:glutamate-1-semialdehyde aminotransferase
VNEYNYKGLKNERELRLIAKNITPIWYNQLIEGYTPAYADHAKGCLLYDIDNNTYIDYIMAYGSIIFGYADEVINNSVIKQLELGSIYSVDTPLRIKLINLLLEWFPKMEMVTFYKSGSEAVQAAIRLARLYTKRDLILDNGFHGWLDCCTKNDSIPKSISDLLIKFDYNNISEVNKLLVTYKNRIAAMIIQPGGDHKTPKPGFLEELQKLCQNNGIIFIFDEVRTGFRMGKGGSQGFFNVFPDLTVISKGMSNGFAISALLGKSEYMNLIPQARLEGTYHHDVIGIAASISTIEQLKIRDSIAKIWNNGKLFMDKMNDLFQSYSKYGISVIGYPPMPKIKFEKNINYKAYMEKFYSSLYANGVYFHPEHHLFIVEAHSKEIINNTVDIVENVLNNMV